MNVPETGWEAPKRTAGNPSKVVGVRDKMRAEDLPTSRQKVKPVCLVQKNHISRNQSNSMGHAGRAWIGSTCSNKRILIVDYHTKQFYPVIWLFTQM